MIFILKNSFLSQKSILGFVINLNTNIFYSKLCSFGSKIIVFWKFLHIRKICQKIENEEKMEIA